MKRRNPYAKVHIKKRKLRIPALLAALGILIPGILSGCGKEEAAEEKTEKQAKGRYVEHLVSLPVQEGEKGVSIIRTPEGTLKVYTKLPGEERYRAYESGDGENFTECSAGWLNSSGGEGQYVKDIAMGEDGSEYALTVTGENARVIRTSDGENGEEVFPETFRDQTGADVIRVLENGDIALFSGMDGRTDIYSGTDGTRRGTLDHRASSMSEQKTFDARGGKAAALGKDHSGFDIFDTGEAKLVQEISCDGIGSEEGLLKFGSQDDCYYLDGSGLYHMSTGGSTVETLIEGTMASMGDQNMRAVGMDAGGGAELFVLYNQKNGGAVLASYTFDKEAVASAGKELTVFGLGENDTVRQTAARFQAEHPDIRVSLRTGNEGEGATSKADQIRLLNTELLSGNGADILILDGMPVESYIEKGVLADLTDFYTELSEETQLLKNVTESMKVDGRIYAMPARMHILCMYGGSDEENALESLDSLSAYLGSGAGNGMIPASSFEKNLKMLMSVNYGDLFVDIREKGPDKDAFLKLLVTAKELCDSTGVTAATVEEYYRNKGGMSLEEAREQLGSLIADGISTENSSGFEEKPRLVLREAAGPTELAADNYVTETYQMEPAGVNGLYIPRGLAGINSASENRELAEEFLKLLFSTDIQSQDLYDGFPVNAAAMDAWCEKTPSDDDADMAVEGNDGEVLSFAPPYGDQLRMFAQIGENADTAVQIDDAVMEMVINEGTAYYKGDKSAEEAVKSIVGKVGTYLAE